MHLYYIGLIFDEESIGDAKNTFIYTYIERESCKNCHSRSAILHYKIISDWPPETIFPEKQNKQLIQLILYFVFPEILFPAGRNCFADQSAKKFMPTQSEIPFMPLGENAFSPKGGKYIFHFPELLFPEKVYINAISA